MKSPYLDMMDAAHAVIKEHNESIGQKDGRHDPGFINIEDFIICIKAQGGTNVERLAAFKYEEILNFLPVVEINNKKIQPLSIAKDIANIWRGRKEKGEDAVNRPVSSRKAERMTPKELVEAYDPSESDSPVGDRLRKISKGKKFIVFEKNSKIIDVATSLKLLLEIKQNYPEMDHVDVNGEPHEVFYIGDIPDSYANENPIWHERPLRPDDTCDQTGRSWDGVPHEVRQLVYLIVENGEVEINIDKAHDIIETSLKSDAFKILKNRYRNSAIEFEKLKNTNELPNLKIVLGRVKIGDSNPFEDGILVAPTRMPNRNMPNIPKEMPIGIVPIQPITRKEWADNNSYSWAEVVDKSGQTVRYASANSLQREYKGNKTNKGNKK